MYGYRLEKNDVCHYWDWKGYFNNFFIDDSQNNLKKILLLRRIICQFYNLYTVVVHVLRKAFDSCAMTKNIFNVNNFFLAKN